MKVIPLSKEKTIFIHEIKIFDYIQFNMKSYSLIFISTQSKHIINKNKAFLNDCDNCTETMLILEQWNGFQW